MQAGYVELLQLQRVSGLPFERVMSLDLVAEKGIAGDCHAKGGEKQIAIISKETKESIQNKKFAGLCFLKFKENMVLCGIELGVLKSGDILLINDAKIIISSCRKRCFPNCPLIQKNRDCQLKTQIIFAKVLQAGTINVGDKVTQNETGVICNS